MMVGLGSIDFFLAKGPQGGLALNFRNDFLRSSRCQDDAGNRTRARARKDHQGAGAGRRAGPEVND